MAFQRINRPAVTFSSFNTILKEDSGYRWVDNKLKEDKLFTEIRMVPSIFADGSEDVVLDPEGVKNDDKIGALGTSFYLVEMCRVWKDGDNIFPTTIQAHDREGNPVAGRQTPVATFMRRLRYKIFEQRLKKQAGQPTDIPAHWEDWDTKGALSNPANMLLCQCIYGTVNGVAQKDMQGNMQWQWPGVFGIPSSAQAGFLAKITSPELSDEPLSLTNNMFGDFASLAGGHVMRLSRHTTQAKGGQSRGKTDYELVKTSRQMPVNIDKLAAKMKSWDEIINIPTVEDSIAILVRLYDPVALDYGFRGSSYAKYLPQEVIGAAKHIAEAAKGLSRKDGAQPAQQTPATQPAAQEPAPRPVQRPVPTAPVAAPTPMGEESPMDAEGEVNAQKYQETLRKIKEKQSKLAPQQLPQDLI